MTPAVLPLGDVTVTWQAVRQTRDGAPVTLCADQSWVNKGNHTDPNGLSRPALELHLSPDATSFMVPAAFLDASSLYEVEMMAIKISGNQTIAGAGYFATEWAILNRYRMPQGRLCGILPAPDCITPCPAMP